MTNLFIFNNLIVTIWNDRFESWTSHLEMLPVDLNTNLTYVNYMRISTYM